MNFPNITHLILKDTFAVLSIQMCRWSFLIHVSFRRMIIKGRNMLFGRDIPINLVFSKYLAKIRLKVDLISVPICILYWTRKLKLVKAPQDVRNLQVTMK